MLYRTRNNHLRVLLLQQHISQRPILIQLQYAESESEREMTEKKAHTHIHRHIYSFKTILIKKITDFSNEAEPRQKPAWLIKTICLAYRAHMA